MLRKHHDAVVRVPRHGGLPAVVAGHRAGDILARASTGDRLARLRIERISLGRIALLISEIKVVSHARVIALGLALLLVEAECLLDEGQAAVDGLPQRALRVLRARRVVGVRDGPMINRTPLVWNGERRGLLRFSANHHRRIGGGRGSGDGRFRRRDGAGNIVVGVIFFVHRL